MDQEGSSGAAASEEPPIVCDAVDADLRPTWAGVLFDSRLFERAVATDAEGFTYVAGTPSAPVELEDGQQLETDKEFLLKFDPEGQFVWGRQFGTAAEYDSVSALAFANNGDLLVGWMSGTFQPDGTATPTRYWILRYDRAGNLLSEAQAPAASLFSGQRIFETPTGELELWGTFGGSWTVGSTTLEGGEWGQVFRLRFLASTVASVDRFGESDSDGLEDAVTDGTGTTYVLLRSQAVLPTGFGDTPHGVLVAFDPQMNVRWTRDLGPDNIAARLVIVDGSLLAVGAAYRYEGDSRLGNDKLFLARFQLDTGEPQVWKEYPLGSSVGFPDWMLQSLVALPNSDVVFGGTMPPYASLGDSMSQSYFAERPFIARLTVAGEIVSASAYCGGGSVLGMSVSGDSLSAMIGFKGDLQLGSFQLHADEGSTALLRLPIE